MVHNVGSVERALRIMVGVLQVLLVLVGPRTLWGLAGLVPLVTGVCAYCPLYHLLGISTADAGLPPAEARVVPQRVERRPVAPERPR